MLQKSYSMQSPVSRTCTTNSYLLLDGRQIFLVWKFLTCLLVLGSLANRCPLISKSRICLLSWGIATTPALETANLFAALSPRIVASGLRIFRNSQTFTLRSSDPETILSSLVNTADVTALKRNKRKDIKIILLISKYSTRLIDKNLDSRLKRRWLFNLIL